MSSESSTIRLRAGTSAIVGFVAAVVALGAIQSSGLELPAQHIERGAVDIILSNLAANSTAAAIVVWAEVIAWASIVIYGVDLYRILADGRSGLLFAPMAMIGGSGLFIIELLLLLGVSQGLAPVYADATGTDQSAIEGSALALLLLRNRLLLVARVLYASAVTIFGREILRSSAFPDWMGYWGYVAGAAGAIGALFPVFVQLYVVGSLGLGLILFWTLIGGIILLRRR